MLRGLLFRRALLTIEDRPQGPFVEVIYKDYTGICVIIVVCYVDRSYADFFFMVIVEVINQNFHSTASIYIRDVRYFIEKEHYILLHFQSLTILGRNGIFATDSYGVIESKSRGIFG